MRDRTRRRVQLLACLLAVAGFVVIHGLNQPVQAAPLVGSTVEDQCYEVCGTAVSCEQDCWVTEGDLPSFHTTCGLWDEGGSNGHCLGECGDGFCNADNDEYYGEESCPEDCGYCGDGACDIVAGESRANCSADCGTDPSGPTCGNSVCEYGETYQTCILDCTNPGNIPDDGVCGSGESMSSTDCRTPAEWCDATHACPTYYQCVDKQCVYNDGVTVSYTCHDSSECAVGSWCKDAWDVFLGQYRKVCVKDIWPN